MTLYEYERIRLKPEQENLDAELSRNLGRVIASLLGPDEEFVAYITGGVAISLGNRTYTNFTLRIIRDSIPTGCFLALHNCSLKEAVGSTHGLNRLFYLDKLISTQGLYILTHATSPSRGPKMWLLADDWCSLLKRIEA